MVTVIGIKSPDEVPSLCERVIQSQFSMRLKVSVPVPLFQMLTMSLSVSPLYLSPKLSDGGENAKVG